MTEIIRPLIGLIASIALTVVVIRVTRDGGSIHRLVHRVVYRLTGIEEER